MVQASLEAKAAFFGIGRVRALAPGAGEHIRQSSAGIQAA
jgi:hypothetical protein